MSRSVVRATALSLPPAALAAPVAAHAVGGVYQLPVPLWLYLAGAATAVAASFAILAVRRPRASRAGRSRRIPRTPARLMHVVLATLGLAWWYGAIAVGFLIGDITPLPAVLLWVGVWIGLPLVAVLAGNPWPAMSPFRTTYRALDAIGLSAARALPYPVGLARWPAVAFLGLAIWAELILPGGDQASTVAVVMVAYTAFTLAAMLAFGPRAWLHGGEAFEVLLGWYGRIGPVDGRCIRGWLAGLDRVRRPGWSDAAFVLLLLSGVTYDGLRETGLGAALLGALLPVVQPLLDPAATFVAVDTLALASVYAAFLTAFAVAVVGSRRLAPARRERIGVTAGRYGAALVPIAAGYLVAHYLTLVLQAAAWLPSLLADPMTSVATDIGWIPTGVVWYMSVVAIVGGHVAAVVVADRGEGADRRRRAALPMVALMLAYTVLSLWIIAQPIVLEPGTRPFEASPAAHGRHA